MVPNAISIKKRASYEARFSYVDSFDSFDVILPEILPKYMAKLSVFLNIVDIGPKWLTFLTKKHILQTETEFFEKSVNLAAKKLTFLTKIIVFCRMLEEMSIFSNICAYIFVFVRISRFRACMST